MGLDIYCRYIPGGIVEEFKEESKWNSKLLEEISELQESLDDDESSENEFKQERIEELSLQLRSEFEDQVGETVSFKKNNAFYKWFIDNTEETVYNCETYYLDKDKVDLLLDTLSQVDHTNAKEKFPETSGLFFGDTGYDEHYWNKLYYLKEKFTEWQKQMEEDPDAEIEFHVWW